MPASGYILGDGAFVPAFGDIIGDSTFVPAFGYFILFLFLGDGAFLFVPASGYRYR